MMQQQMSLFQEGGLEQDGGTVDPVSGNEVPVGSSQEEVRDDIPAQLSEGEFVFPADVVRFLGLEFLMNLRQRAKAGLKKMEEMGQMGNSEEATIPDDVPFTIDDLDMEDDPQEMAEGGVMAANGVFTQPSKFKRTPDMGINPPSENVQQPIADEQATFYDAPAQTTEQQPIASFDDLFGGDVSYGYDELRKYVGPNGEIEYIAFKDGQPLPAYAQKLKDLTDKGFTYEDPTKVEEEDPRDVMVDTAQVTQKEDKDRDPTSFESMQRRENQIQENYKDAIRRAMEQGDFDNPMDAVQYIKDGNYTVMGKKVPAFLFPDIKLANQTRDQEKFQDFSLEIAAQQIADLTTDPRKISTTSGGKIITDSDGTVTTGETQPMSVLDYPEPSQADTDTMVDAIQPVVKQPAPKEDKPEPVVSDMPMGSKPITASQTTFKDDTTRKEAEQEIQKTMDKTFQQVQDPSQIAQANKAASQSIAQGIKAFEDRQAEREKNQAKAKQETKKETFQQKLSRRGGFKEGGIASKKPKKKKVMKRGGLASKK